MATIGIDCDIILIHPNVNSGNPYGFMLDHTKSAGPMISVQREATLQADDTYLDTFRFFFTILITDNARQPDGNLSAISAATYYTMLLDYMSQHTGISINTWQGVFTDLLSVDHYSTETQLESAILVALQLSSAGSQVFFPADFDQYVSSLWTIDAYVGPMNWNNSYWRA